uniref:Uncharacterized protein n=1 Tax=Aquisalinus luteolus TaxID=1566827 RepID=A0A8J3A3L7_9PROT|nr:hypothetical protein GCM10011355_26400 [Aquisalinus luteolus]
MLAQDLVDPVIALFLAASGRGAVGSGEGRVYFLVVEAEEVAPEGELLALDLQAEGFGKSGGDGFAR